MTQEEWRVFWKEQFELLTRQLARLEFEIGRLSANAETFMEAILNKIDQDDARQQES